MFKLISSSPREWKLIVAEYFQCQGDVGRKPAVSSKKWFDSPADSGAAGHHDFACVDCSVYFANSKAYKQHCRIAPNQSIKFSFTWVRLSNVPFVVIF